MKPGVIPLRPLGVGEILDGAVSTIRAHPLAMLGIPLVAGAVLQLLGVVVDFWIFRDESLAWWNDDSGPWTTPGSGVVDGILLLGQIPLTGLVAVIVSRAVMGQPVSPGEIWPLLRPRLLALAGLTVLVFLATAVGVVACLFPGVLIWVLFSLAAPALILEGQPVIEAVRRSSQLVWPSWFRCFGVLALAWLIAQVIGFVAGVPFFLLGGGLAEAFGLSDGTGAGLLSLLIFMGLGFTLVYGLIMPFVAAVTTLLYVDQRMRREGLDIELARATGARPHSGPQGSS